MERQQIMAAMRRAAEAGDHESAKRLAEMYKMAEQETAPEVAVEASPQVQPPTPPPTNANDYIAANPEWGARTNPISAADQAGLQMATGLASTAASGYNLLGRGAVNLASQMAGYDTPEGYGRRDIVDSTRAIQEGGTYQPRTEGGQQLSNALAYPFVQGEKYSGQLGQAMGEPFGLAAEGKTAGEVAFGTAAILAGKPWKIGSGGKNMSRLERDLNKVVGKGFDQGIKKTGFLKTRKKIAGELQKEVTAVKSFIKNKGSLEMKDAYGELIKGKLPKNLDQLSQANQQRMVDAFQSYNDLQIKAGKQGAMVAPDAAIAALDVYVNDKVILSSAPEASIAYATKQMTRLKEAGPLTPAQAQKAMAIRNESINAYMKNPTPENASAAGVDAIIANNLRETLNATVEAQGGEGYAVLKKTYGAHKSIDAAINKALQKDNRYVGMSSLNFYNVLGAKEMARGVLRAEPSSFVTGLALELVHGAIKMVKDPNRAARRMLQKSEKIIKQMEKLEGRERMVKILDEIVPASNNLPAVVDPYQRLLNLSQTPEGMQQIMARLGREKKYADLLGKLRENQKQLLLEAPEPFLMKEPFGPQPPPRPSGQAIRAENQLIGKEPKPKYNPQNNLNR